MINTRLLSPTEAHLLRNVAEDVFDHPLKWELAAECLNDDRHHLAVALSESGQVVGMASAVHYVHPDKPAQLFINEVGVSAAFQGQGIGKQLIASLLARGRELGCSEAWVTTERDNMAAQALYSSCGGVREPDPIVMFTFPLPGEAECRGHGTA